MARDSLPDATANLRAIPRDRLIDRAAQEIKDFILGNELVPGDRVPSETELAKSLRVSRNVVRQAISSLEAIGVVRVAHGRGIYVADVANTDVFRQIASWLDTSDLHETDFFEVRSIFERGVLELVIERAADADLDRLEAVARRLQEAREEGEIGDLHDQFHRALLEATGNRFLVTLGTILSRFFWSVGYDSPHVYKWSAADLQTNHLHIVELLRRRCREDIPSMIHAHLEYGEAGERPDHRPGAV